MDTSLIMQKARMRRRARALRRVLAIHRTMASEQAARLAPVHLWPTGGAVAGYLAMAAEIDPGPLLNRLAAVGAPRA